MKKVLMFVFFVSISTQAQVLWYGNPDSSFSSLFYRFDAGNYPGDECSGGDGTAVSTYGTTVDPVYGKVWKVTKPTRRKRGEIARTSFVPTDGQTLYYGWRWKIDSSPDLTGGIAVFQWKTDASTLPNTQNYPLNLGYGGGVLTLNIWGPCASGAWNTCSGSIDNRRITIWSKPVAEGDWVSIVIKLKLSRDKNLGEVEFWFNGVQQTFTNSPAPNYSINLSTDKKIAYHKTFDGNVTYPKWGSYNATSCNFAVETFYDEMRIGSDLESVINPLGGLLSAPDFSVDSKVLKIYPNPVNENGVLFVESKNSNLPIQIFDVHGKQLFNQKSISETTPINLQGFKTGTYILKVGDESSKFIVK